MPRFQPLGRVVVSSAADIIIAALLVGWLRCCRYCCVCFTDERRTVYSSVAAGQVAADERMLIATTIFLYLFLRS